MKVACVYTVETYDTIEKPLSASTEIPFGIATILTALEQAGHAVELFVVTPDTPIDEHLGDYIATERPGMFCFTAVSTQYWQAKRIAQYVREQDESIFCVLGGHEASLNSETVIQQGLFDAICIGEGERAVVELAKGVETGVVRKDISNLWFHDRSTGEVQKNANAPFYENLDDLPLFNRRAWDKWIRKPDDYPSILLGRGCPFKCTYCSNHAMERLSEGRFVRFRSPEHILSELDYLVQEYPKTERVYLEVETFGANRKASYSIFDALARYNESRDTPLRFGVNLALTSGFMNNSERVHETLTRAKAANLTTINIGLESGSERLRKEVLIRPPYKNDELVRFCQIAREYDIKIIFFVLLGLPGETIVDYMETVKACRAAQPHTAYVSIFYPYLGTDLATVAINMGLIEPESLTPEAERSKATLDMEGFSSKRIRFEYIVFWWRVYRGHWSSLRIAAHVIRALLQAHPRLYSLYLYMRNNVSLVFELANRLSPSDRRVESRKLVHTVGTRVDVVRE